jgi:transcriptional repressor NrdR
VIKKDRRREEFNKEKLLSGIQKACGKRPLPIGAVEKLADDIEAEIYHTGKSEIASYRIGDMVMDGLRGLDYIAYIRFASVYREFSDITALKEEVDTLVSAGVVRSSKAGGQLPLLPDDKPENLVLDRNRSRNGKDQ